MARTGVMVTGHRIGPFRLLLLRLFAWLWRFRTLALSAKVFSQVTSPCFLKRRFLGHWLYLDVFRSSAQRLLYLEGERFIAELSLVRNLVRAGSIVVDVGANIGYYTLLFEKAIGPGGRIVAFEPEPDNLIELRMNVERNGLSNVSVQPYAVGSRAGMVSFAKGINGGVRGDIDSMTGDAIQVPMVTLDEALAGPVDLIKVDVEGYEEEVLLGAKGIIQRFRPNLFVEIHPTLMTGNHTAERVISLLSQYYSQIDLYQPARCQSVFGKALSRYSGVGSVERLPSWETVANLCRQGRQDTFWAICRSRRDQ